MISRPSSLRIGFLTSCAWLASAGFALPLIDDTRDLSPGEISQGYSETRLLARPLAGADTRAFEAQLGLGLRHTFSQLGDTRVLTLPTGLSSRAAMQALRASGLYQYVEPDYILKSAALPNDPRRSEQWALANNGAQGGVTGADMEASAAWDIRNDASTIIVAVVDSGVLLTHEDIAANLWVNPGETAANNSDDDRNGYRDDVHGINATVSSSLTAAGKPNDDHGHGSHVAGIVGAVANNNRGIAGVAWKVKIMPLKFLDDNGEGLTSDAVQCIDYAIAKGAKVINGSYGAITNNAYSQTAFDAIQRARANGIVFVAAAGNSALNLDRAQAFPADYGIDNIITVGSSDRRDEPSYFSNYGSGAVDLFAPGEDILSLGISSTNSYVLSSGTSMSAPQVSGAVALLMAQFPGDTYRGTINRLLRGAENLNALAGMAQTSGRLNLRQALSTTTNRPFNDNFAERATLRGSQLRVRSANQLATSESAEPNHAGVSKSGSLWWSWTAPSDTTVSVTTTGSAYDTVLAVYTGSQLSGLTPIASNDNLSGETTSGVEFNSVAGTTYHIAVAAKGSASGLTLLSLNSVPVNDNRVHATILTGSTFRVEADNAAASSETAEPLAVTGADGSSVWFTWTAPSTGSYQFSTFSEEVDPAMAIYAGNSDGGPIRIAANDDAKIEYFVTNSLVSINATSGTIYLIQVDTMGGLQGSFTLTGVPSTWQFVAGSSITGAPALAPDGDIVFGATDQYVYKVSPSGNLRWSFPTPALIDTASVGFGTDGTVYTPCGDGYLYALGASDGQLLWSFNTGGDASNSPAVGSDGTIYIRSGVGSLFAISPNGTEKWRAAVPGTSYSSPVVGQNGWVYVGSTDNKLYAFNALGAAQGTFDAGSEIYSTPAIDREGNVYFGTLGGEVYAVTADLQLLWQRTLSDSTTSSFALSTNRNALYFGGYDHFLHALDLQTGEDIWQFDLGDEVRASSPTILADGRVLIGSYDGYLYDVNPDGTLHQRFATAAIIRSSPLVTAGRLYFGAGDYKLYAVDGDFAPSTEIWPTYRQNPARTGVAIEGPPPFSILQQPQSQYVTAGTPIQVALPVNLTSGVRFEWYRNNALVTTTFEPSLAFTATAGVTDGVYFVKAITNDATLTSETFSVSIVGQTAGRLVNLSARSNAGVDDRTLIVGFFVGGDAGAVLPVLVRGIGPELARFPVEGLLADPQITLVSNGETIATNDNWGGTQEIIDTSARIGAFSLENTTGKDAVILREISPGGYTALVTGVGGTSGIALAEIYDAGDGPGTTSLINLSARTRVESGDGVLIAGFYVNGGPVTILARAIGPGLAQHKVGDRLADPELALHSGDDVLLSNDDWPVSLEAVSNSIGAFPLDPGSADAVLVAVLPPGGYTLVTRGKNGTTGVALVELYVLP